MIETEFQAGAVTLTALDNQGGGTVIIGLHGYMDNAASLEPLAPFLHNFRFIALDMAGHGSSTHRPYGSHYNLVDYLQDLHAMIEHQGFEQVVLLGHSLGGILATMYAGIFPDKVIGVVSIDACGPLTESADTTAAQLKDSIESRYKRSRNRLKVVDLEQAVAARCQISDIGESHARAILQRNLTQDAGGHYFWASDPKLRTRSNLRLTEEQAKALMASITCPVYFAAASDSFKNLRERYGQRASWFKHAQCDYFTGGHHVHMEKPEEIGPAVAHFVEQL
ncbi:alpha/beta hydrolase [Salinimonas marina]|uniref:Alpha/beta hydrolase n=1 Tax=Salinimonas marina TaxID=2785918 RepID=A0A7S9HDX4_9ALTE|nr:alpha/beta hydrolase [Salinimonas marina]QPG06650.1 alpha/beta hydrolase [Salinimonas marina]